MLALPRTFRALRYRNFRLFFIGQGLSVLGTWLQQVAMGWLTYRLSGSVWLLAPSRSAAMLASSRSARSPASSPTMSIAGARFGSRSR
jgi:hypothetical protein